MLCYYIIFDKNSSLYENLKLSWDKNIVQNPTKTKFKNLDKNIYELDKNSDYSIVFLSIKWEDSSKLEKFLNKEKAVYDVLGDIEKPKIKTNLKFKKIDIALICILFATIGACVYYKDLLLPQVLEVYNFAKTKF